MNAKLEWNTKKSGVDCPFDLPRDRVSEFMLEVAKLSIATLYLEKNQTYRGHCVLVFDPRHVTRIDELDAAEWSMLSTDIRATELALMKTFQPDHINIASLGQVVPHLHWHIIPRYVDDPRWGGPIWTTNPEEMQQVCLENADYAERVSQIKRAIADGEG